MFRAHALRSCLFTAAALLAGLSIDSGLAAQSASAAPGVPVAVQPGGILEANSATWTFDQTTSGGDINWTSPTSVDAGASVYNTAYKITTVAVTVKFLNIPFGPFDVTNQIPPEQSMGGGPIDGPAPFTIISDMLTYPLPPDPPSISALVTSGMNAGGFGFFSATGVTLGTLSVNLGFPFGTQNVQITSIRIAGSLTIHATWFNEGFALAGELGDPLLTGAGTLVGAEVMSLDLTSARPSASAFLLLGFTAINAPLKGGILVPSADIILGPFPTDVNGDLLLGSTWPSGLPSDLALHYQYWIPDAAGVKGFAASNALRSVTP